MNYDDLEIPDLPPIGSVSTVTVGPDDRLVVAFEQRVTQEQAETIRARVEQRLGVDADRILVIGGGARITVIKP